MAKWNRNPDVRADLSRKSVNQVMAERTLVHQMDLQRVAEKEGDRIVRLLADAQNDILNQLNRRMSKIEERGVDWGPVTTRRLGEMEQSFGEIVDNWGKESYNTQRDFLYELSRDEMDFQKKLLSDTSPVKLEMVLPSRQTLRAIVTNEPIAGTPLRKWWNKLEATTQANLNRTVNLGMVEGQTIDQIARRIRGTRALQFKDGILDQTARQARAIARTGVNHVSNRARDQLFRENEDVVKASQWLSTLDSRTCLTCANLDQKQWPLGESHIMPPAHVQCRCTLIPVMKSWKELGIKANELEDTTRASMNGQVSAKMNYEQWLKTQSTRVQNRALGPRRAERWRDGKETVSQFVSADGYKLTLNDLRRIEERKKG